ncbi:MAG: NAD(P)-dependent oxidoreductase [Caldilineaceae bacterium]|nr:NAD(P)-dependent oxidoreductase [Caldilineaceae bacterium]
MMALENSTHPPQNILITGAAGAIGQTIAPYLRQRGHQVRGLDRSPMPHMADTIQANLADAEAVQRAAQGMDVVLHLGAYRNNADFMDVLLEPNVVGLYNVCEAARLAGVKRLVLASTLQVVDGFDAAAAPIHIADGPRPINHYALTKLWAEEMGAMYARCHNLAVLNVRVGWFARDAAMTQRIGQSERGRDIYFSQRDAQHFFARAVESAQPQPGECITVFATSHPTHQRRLDLEPARQHLGYEPLDQWPQGSPP